MLQTTYLGLPLKNPIVASASPLSRNLDDLRKLEDSGAAAVVFYSLFEEEINAEGHALDSYLTENTESHAEALSYFPRLDRFGSMGPADYLNKISEAKAALDIPIIASLNGVSSGGWIQYAKYLEDAGADALEINLYYIPTDPFLNGVEIEQMYLQVLRHVKATISIPVAMKLNPFFSSLPNMATQFQEAGADGLVLFNRFYQPDLDLENLDVSTHLVYSTSDELRLPLRWIALLYGRVTGLDYALTTGVHTAEDVLKGVAAGASVVMLASALLQHGPEYIRPLLKDVEAWLVEKEYDSLKQLKGSLSQVNCPSPAAFERANYIKLVGSFLPTHK
ncbi:MAG: dihydroorotate dehydrogenase (fumarate) [Cellvibrionaceae bacterium]|jgi:dihydroorotate dehydrogenase (fumarate)